MRNCRLGYNGRWGILTGFVDDFLAEDNEAHHSQVEHGIYVSNSATARSCAATTSTTTTPTACT